MFSVIECDTKAQWPTDENVTMQKVTLKASRKIKNCKQTLDSTCNQFGKENRQKEHLQLVTVHVSRYQLIQDNLWMQRLRLNYYFAQAAVNITPSIWVLCVENGVHHFVLAKAVIRRTTWCLRSASFLFGKSASWCYCSVPLLQFLNLFSFHAARHKPRAAVTKNCHLSFMHSKQVPTCNS